MVAGPGRHAGGPRGGAGQAERAAGAHTGWGLGAVDRAAVRRWAAPATAAAAPDVRAVDRSLASAQLDHQPGRHQSSGVRVRGPRRRPWCAESVQLVLVSPASAGADRRGSSADRGVRPAVALAAATGVAGRSALELALAGDQPVQRLGADHPQPQQGRSLHRPVAADAGDAVVARLVAMGALAAAASTAAGDSVVARRGVGFAAGGLVSADATAGRSSIWACRSSGGGGRWCRSIAGAAHLDRGAQHLGSQPAQRQFLWPSPGRSAGRSPVGWPPGAPQARAGTGRMGAPGGGAPGIRAQGRPSARPGRARERCL